MHREKDNEARVARIATRRPAEFRVESSSAILGGLWPSAGARELVLTDRALAVAVAAKCRTHPRAEVRVVHIPSGEIVFRKSA